MTSERSTGNPPKWQIGDIDGTMSGYHGTLMTLPFAAQAHRPVALPASGWQAVWRGMRSVCPRCGDAHLFARFLKPMPVCPGCGQNWTHQRADDFPAYISMIITGHLLAPLVIALELAFRPPVGVLAALVVPSAMILMLALLQPAKGAVIAMQWWNGMHGFKRERPAEPFSR